MLRDRVLRYLIQSKKARSLRLPSTSPSGFTPQPRTRDCFLYVHIPFCRELCPFCSFHRAAYEPALARRYFEALRTELRLYHDMGFDFGAVYFGGGTPTIDMRELGSTIEVVRELFSVKMVSVETNPDHLTEDRMDAMVRMGVNRVSVGVQSLDDDTLKQIKRYASYGSSSETMERLRCAGHRFDTLNVDMIFNWPGQSMRTLRREIDQLVALDVDQITWYPLMNSVPDDADETDRWCRVDHRNEKRFYSEILERLGQHMKPRTVWCFSRNGSMIDEYIVSHDEYVGAGSGAFGYLDGTLVGNTFSFDTYLQRLGEGQLPIVAVNTFSLKERMRYDLLMQLFTGSIDMERNNRKYDGRFSRALWKDILFFRCIRALKLNNGRASLTREGMYYWLIMMREFFEGVGDFRKMCKELNR